jgi:peptide/nickel transport system substrate-binding protein
MAGRLALVMALLLVFALALAGCGNGGSGGGTGTGTGGGDTRELVIGIAGSPASIDVNQEAGILNYYIAAIAQEGLVSISNDGEVIPALAESWTDDDATVWTFKLRKGAKFQDGTDVTADDIVFSIEQAQDPVKSPGTSIYFPKYVQSVEQTADDEVRITLDGPHASFIWSVSNAGGLFVTSRAFAESAKAIGSPQELILGSGPYKAVEFEPGSHATFEAVDTWWNGKPAIESVRFDFIADENTRLLAFTQGDLDFALNIPVEQSEQWEKVEGATVEYVADRSYFGLTFDPGVEPFGDEHVRRAVAYAIDKEGIVSGSILKGHGTAATAIPAPEQFASVFSASEAAQKLANVAHYDYSIEKAKEELALSSVPDGFETTIYYPDSYQNAGKASLAIAESLKDLGITLNVKEIPLDQWLGEVGDGNQGVAWMIYYPTTAEPGEITNWLLDAQGAGYNPANWTNKAVSALTARVMGADSLEAQIDPILESNNIAQELAIYAPVFWGQAAVAYSSRIQLDGYGSYTLLTTNWPDRFTKS